MSERWMPHVKLPLTIEQFHQLPQNSAYKYEYFAGHAHLSPRPKHFHALLDLQPMSVDTEEVSVQRTKKRDLPALARAFAGAFHRTQPFACLDEATRKLAARECLEKTCAGGDGPWLKQASFVAREREADRPIGGIFITLLPNGDPHDWDSYCWTEPPPADCVARRLGRPHLTWIFVSPRFAGNGVGSALLAAAVNVLVKLGYRQLLTTFLLGNDASTLWHWRHGFQLLSYPTSRRLMRKRMEKWKK